MAVIEIKQQAALVPVSTPDENGNLVYAGDLANQAVRVNVVATTGSSGGDGAINDGANSAIKATVFDLTNSNPVATQIVDANGDAVSVGGGTQYTEGDTEAAIVGTAILWEDAADTLRAVSAAKPLPISDAGGSLTVDGPLTDTELRATPVPVSGTVSVTEPITVDATDLDIRNLVFATDKVDVSGSSSVGVTGTFFQATQPVSAVSLPLPTGAATAALQTQPGVDIGDVTINNGAAGAAVNIQDGGNTITVDGTVTAAAQPGVDIGDVTINNAAGAAAVNVQDGGNSLTVDGTVSANLNAGTNNIGDVDVLTIAAGDNNIGNVDIVTMPNVTLAAGTNTNEVVGDVAADAPAAGNPVLVAASSETMADSAPANRVSQDADATRLSATDGALFVIPTGPQTWSYHEDSSSALTDAAVHAAPAAGLSIYVTDIVFSLGAATAINIFFEEGSTKVLGPWYLEAINGRGLAVHFGTPKKITAATALTVTTSAAVAHSIDIQGFIAPG